MKNVSLLRALLIIYILYETVFIIDLKIRKIFIIKKGIKYYYACFPLRFIFNELISHK